ncbi:amidohydrolase family protein [Kaistia geumhonensis]|uniref:TIM-barrel fold metal-dependent hydrolase n=1 Tax=Kaistia geumhonensis TaxID=410839 RepID=A0ABU0M9J3_9HYPH|nr:amidohydrolase family protein [Kaistia geumhonensis]MCX5480662.1 amidohydrolase family protein [Kaistia geumhonensis]MDQ0517634.1 putative TIM-barrel fold metal-dependent hydrolase [Kaistia geumhonensis]
MTARAYCDCHVNIWNEEHVLPLYTEQLARVRAGAMAPKSDADTLHAEMAHVEKAIVFALRYGDSIGIESDDETTAAAVAKYPEKFVGFAYVDPRRADCMELLVHAVEDLKLKGVKFGPIYNGVALSDPRLVPVYEYLQKNNIPLTMHMGTTFARNAPIDMGRPLHVEPIAQKYPDLVMVMAHMGHPWYEECIVVSRKQPNVFCEISALSYRPWQYYNILIAAQEYRITDKIFFGTDFPFARVDESVDGLLTINDQVEGTRLPRVSEETMQRILESNPFTHWWHGDNPLA